MAVAVVEGLEVVDVGEQERDRLALANALRPDALQVFVEAAPVVDAGEPVLQRRFGKALSLEPGDAARMLEAVGARDADDVGDQRA